MKLKQQKLAWDSPRIHMASNFYGKQKLSYTKPTSMGDII